MENFRHCNEWQNELQVTGTRTPQVHVVAKCGTLIDIYTVRTGTRFNKSGDRNNIEAWANRRIEQQT